MPSGELWILNQGKPRPITPQETWAGGSYSSTNHPKSFSFKSVRTLVRWNRFKERPLSKRISIEAGPTGDIGDQFN